MLLNFRGGAEMSTDLVLAECASSPASVRIEISNSGWDRPSEVSALASARLSARLLHSASAVWILHKGLVGGGGCPTAPFLVLPKGDFILIGGEVAHTFGLTSAITLGMAKSYDGPVSAEVWDEGIAHHAALMARGEGAGMVPRPDPSTSDTNVAADLDAELERTQLHLRC
ncbi:hypothetical protein B296_00027797 [Ensete ventricosum]|uniref:Uncharacterized protein n=1 Tax=Ensete ventricosum TaxID=4639 RepID=A0A426XE55_ENSVE|nr:hypothetical protein B296_00027797 [Ensete ventricosum]